MSDEYRVFQETDGFGVTRFYVEVKTLVFFWQRPYVNECGEKHHYDSISEAKTAISAYKTMSVKPKSLVVHTE